jgi:hypothetical protein
MDLLVVGAMQLALVAQRVQCAPVGDAHDPGRHTGRATKLAGLGPDHPERVVDDFLGKLVARRQSLQEPRQPAVIGVIELIERAPVLQGDAPQQEGVVGLGTSGWRGHMGECRQAAKKLHPVQKRP